MIVIGDTGNHGYAHILDIVGHSAILIYSRLQEHNHTMSLSSPIPNS